MIIKINNAYGVSLVTNSPQGFAGWVLDIRENQEHGQRIGSFQGFYDDSYLTADLLAHWQVDCLVHKSYEDFGEALDGFSEVLFKNTSCKEPAMVNMYFVEWSEGQRKTFGRIFSEE